MSYDVVIAGGGPVGLFLACELALARCSVLILEKEANPHSAFKQLPFGIRGLNTPSIEALDRRGLIAELEVHKRLKNPHQNAAQGMRRQGGHFAGIPFLDGSIDVSRWNYRLPSSTETNLISEMAEIESVFARRAETLGMEIRRGLAVNDFSQTNDGVTVRAGDQTFESRWLVGCDGGRSAIRKAGSFEFAGTEPEFTGYSAQVELADAEKLGQGRVLTETGMYFQSQPGYLVMMEFDGGVSHRAEPVTRERFQEALRRVSGTDVTVRALHAVATWTDRARQVKAYRNGRVLLAGDAAHIYSPLGGQGLNLGLGDAMNLGWKLGATIQGRAPEGLLDSYQTERAPFGEWVLNWSRAQVAIMKPDPASRALNAIVRDLIDTRDGASYFATRVWGVDTKYDLGGDHPLVGRSVPNFELEDGTTVNESMGDGRGMLLDFSISASLEAVASENGLNYVLVRSEESFGLSAALVRPDGVVAWVSAGKPDESSLRQAAAVWFAR